MNAAPAAVPEDLRRLARLCGVLCDFVDGTGTRRRASAETLVAVLQCLGVPLPGPQQASEALQWRRQGMRAAVLPPVLVGDAGGIAVAPVGAAAAQGRYRLWLRLQDGSEQSSEGRVEDLPARRGGRQLSLRIPEPGVHRMVLELDGGRHVASLLARPVPPPSGARRWGAFLPLQLLGRPGSHAVGTLDRAAAAGDWLASLGGTFLGMLPALATSRAEVSPYSPISRCFWSELYLAADWLPSGCPAPAPLSPAVANDAPGRERLPQGGELDMARTWQEVDALLDGVLQWLDTDAAAPVQQDLQRFAASHPRARAWAAWRTHAEAHGEDWRAWPVALQNRQAAIAAAEPSRARRHLVAMWLSAQQWRRLGDTSTARGVDLYLDLPLGVPAASFDAWWWREELVSGCSIGAPPDRFFPEGQDWGLLPPHPQAQRLAGYAQLRAALRHHLSVARLLRIDHVMGLHRLYWVPAGASPHEGTYVRYPAAELHALHAIEAWRRGATLVGEDLGTVPTAVRSQMRERGMRRMWIALAELDPDPGSALSSPPVDALASLSTHDMPTFCGYWTDADIHRRAALGRLPQHRIDADKAARDPSKQALMRFLEARGMLHGYAAHEIAAACLRWLADAGAELLVVSPEDLLGETVSINIPGAPPAGTVPAANWLRAAPGLLERLLENETIAAALRDLDARRRHPQAGAAC